MGAKSIKLSRITINEIIFAFYYASLFYSASLNDELQIPLYINDAWIIF
jgi:hypothetical protein